ncbi:YitT family protein [Mycoplasmopsis verecunda]|uniref:Uncharacterized 5xTM membrane BCR, YitT family COG1284 n=1 Tax=Mycoplasmopsis verecunda TaxID=171291 RepID=A0A1T4M668_9BACT|nr:YitT family protein [Mycoplasmopsis verecunda]WPB54511.1 YitT family protein [Mycoplasmopsis verecunda]SJZ62367.1 Uncharacterised 5xTM membrane BCR, YitT family COG1284 [Mycoplasmopsis verecunda]
MKKQHNTSEGKSKFKLPTSNDKIKKKMWTEILKKKPVDNYLISQSAPAILDTEKIISEEEYLKYKMGQYLLNNKQKQKRLTFKEFILRYWFRVLLLFCGALVFNFGIHIFLAKSDTIPSGITGIPTILQYLFPVMRQYFALIYFACNVPLFIIFWKKVKRSFLIYTLVFMFFLQITNFIFVEHAVHVWFFDKISFLHNDYDDFTLIYNPSEMVDLKAIETSQFKISPEYQPGTGWKTLPLIQAVNYLEKGTLTELLKVANDNPLLSNIISPQDLNNWTLEQLSQLVWYAEGQTWPILLYGSIGAAFIGMGIALSWKAGGSTGGTDIIAYFFSTKYKKSVGGILSMVALITACVYLVIYGFVRPNINGEIFGMRELSTFAYLIVTNVVVNILYPKYKKVKLTIISSEPEKVIAYFKLINYWHSYRLVRFKSGYTGKYQYKIETVALLLETKNIISDLKLVDPKIWISAVSVGGVIGSFNTKFVEQ